MRFKKTIAAGVAACVMAASAASLVKSVSALSAESPAAATDVTIELIGLTDDYAARVPLQTILDNMTYAYDVFEEAAPDEGDTEDVSAGVSESDPEGDGESVSESESTEEGALADEPENAEDDSPADEPENEPESEPTGAPENENESLPESEPADVPEDNADTNDDTVVVVPDTPALPEPDHRRGDKIEIGEDAEFVWIDGERYSVSDKTAVVNLFVEDSGDEYIIEKSITVGNGEEERDAGNAFYNAQFRITKNRWTFEDFELYTIDVNGEKTILNADLGDIRVNSAAYIIKSAPESGKNIYLKLSPRMMKNGEPLDDVDVDVVYYGENPKDDRILTDGGIVVDFLAFDKERNMIAEQKGVAITAGAGTLRLGAVIDPEGEEPVVIDEACAPDLERYDAAELNAVFEAGFDSAEHTLKIGSLYAEAMAAELTENDVIKAVFGRFASLEDAQDADDIKAQLFGDGFATEIGDGAELTLFIEPKAVLGLAAKDMTAFAVHIRFGIAAGDDDNKPGDDPNKPSDPDKPNDPNVPDDPNGTEPNDPADPTEENVELYYDGSADKVYFDNISKGEFVLDITSSTDSLSNFDAALTDTELVALGDVEVSGGSAKITLNAVRGADDEILYGSVRGTLTITADNAEPLVIELSGKSGYAAIAEQKTWNTAMKYVPYLAEYSLDREYPWLSVAYSVIGELPEGLSLDAESGKLSGAPTATGRYSFEIAADLTYADEEDSPAARITREVEFTVANNTARNLYMLTDPDYGFYRPLGESIDGRAYYLSSDEAAGKLKVTLKGECSEFYDLWLDGEKLTRRSDDYKMLHGATEITFYDGAFSWLSEDEIHTLVFAYKPNSSDNLKLAAQNLIITSDKSAIASDEGTARDYYNMYTPVNKLGDDLDSDYAKALSSVRLYAASGALPEGVKTLVRANTAESKGGVAMDIIIAGEQGEELSLDGSVTAKMYLPEGFDEDVYVYFIENEKYRPVNATVRDGQVFFTLDGSKTVIVSQRTIDPNAKSGGNPATGVALSSAGLVTSGAALVMILTSKRKKSV